MAAAFTYIVRRYGSARVRGALFRSNDWTLQSKVVCVRTGMVKCLQILPSNIKSNSASAKVSADFQVYWCFSYQHEGFNLLSKQLMSAWIYFWNISRPLRPLQCYLNSDLPPLPPSSIFSCLLELHGTGMVKCLQILPNNIKSNSASEKAII